MTWLKAYKSLMLEGDFYRAHVTAEEIMRELNRKMGQCLAVYAALALKVNEKLPRAIEHLLNLLEKRGCGDYIDLECARRLAYQDEKVDGESIVCLKPI